ncbi:DUF2171 domain-containing protein [Sphingosinicella sp.]|uniref:DUF2171 domain-containing protein n=1 Tax=Sphingosinicella sp. TaxID=1917971 RepID=UPI00403815CC
MAYDNHLSGRGRGERWRDEEHEARWQGDDSFGAGWGNQTAEFHPADEEERRTFGHRRPRHDRRSDIGAGGPGFAPDFAGPLPGRAEFGRQRNVGYLSAPSRYGFAPGDRDPHYAEWRDRQIAALDRDYDEYRRENQSRFDREFGAWRDKRGRQREALERVTEHMEVLGSDGQHVGTVDKVRGDSVILTRNDAAAGGVHHSIPCGWIEEVGDKVTLNLGADDAKERWRTESRNRALFEREDSGSRGPHMLNRAFSGTYPEER